MLTGLHTPAEIFRIADEQWGFRTKPTRKTGGNAIARSGMYRMFVRPFYYGWFEYPKGSGKLYKGKHEPMVTEAEFNRVQVLLSNRGKARPQLPLDFAYSGLIRCGECNRRVTAEEKRQIICTHCKFKFHHRKRDSCIRCALPIEDMQSPRFPRYAYYHCSKSRRPRCPQKYVREAELDRQIQEYLAYVELSKDFKDWALKYLHELHEMEKSARAGILQAQQKRYQDCLRRIDNLIRLKTSPVNVDGTLLSDKEYETQRGELLKEKTGLEQMLGDKGQQAEQALKLSERVLEFSVLLQSKFAKGDANTKKRILSTLVSHLTLKDGNLLIEAKKPFCFLENSPSGSKRENEPIAPENNGSAPTQKEANTSLSPELGDIRDDVLTNQPANKKLVAEIYHFFRSFMGSPSDTFADWSEEDENSM
jgi:hypothetical protein